MEGLEISEVSLGTLDLSDRADAEYVTKENLRIEKLVRHLPHKKLGSLCELTASAFYPSATDLYNDTGLPFVRCVDCIDYPLISALQDGTFERLPESFVKENASIRLVQRGDIVITKVGSPCYASLVHEHESLALSRTVLGATRIKDVDPYYLTVFLRCYHGFLQLMRQREQTIQFQLTLERVRDVDVFLPSSQLQEAVSTAFKRSFDFQKAGREHLVQAEALLLHALGMDTWTPPEALSYVRTSSQAFAAGRLDAQFFAPRVEQLLARLGRDGLRLSDVAPARHERFEPTGSSDFDYIEIGSLGADGTAASESVPMAEAPSRATQHVRAGDVITSTVRPIRRLSALIAPEQDGAVCSSGFVVLQPQGIRGEVLLTYLRLPLVCELMDLHTSATMYPAISESDLLALPIPAIAPSMQSQVQDAVRQSAHARHRASRLLDAAKRAVEIAIEDGEPAALRHLRDVL